MRWKFCGGFLLMLLMLVCPCLIAHGQNPNDILYTIKAPFQSVSPVADGTIGAGEYSNSLFVSYVDRANPGNPFPNLDHMCPTNCDLDTESPTALGDADLSATWYFAHTDQFLFIAANVTDGWLEYDTIGAASFQNDAVELYMDPDADGMDNLPGNAGECFHIWADASNGLGVNGIDGGAVTADDIPFNNRASDAYAMAVTDPEDLDTELGGTWYSAGLVHSPTNYVIEFQIPLVTMDVADGPDDEVAPKTGDTLRFTAVIDDNDRPAGSQDTYAELWYVAGDANSNWGGGEENWVVGLELSEAAVVLPGDFNDSGAYDTGDIDILTAQSASNQNNKPYDLTNDNLVNEADVKFWAKDLADTWIGDANYDRQFTSDDFVAVFAVGKYEVDTAAVWTQGDWNGDGRFTSADFVAAFADGGYEVGLPPAAVSAVPEPATWILMLLGALACLLGRRRRE